MSPSNPVAAPSGWLNTAARLLDRRILALLFLGFSAGLPLFLIFSSLALWLREAGIERSAVTYFSWAALGYSFKFVWAPLIDRLPVPLLTRRLGRRRAWLLVAQCFVILAILAMAFTDPAADQGALMRMALAAVLLGFSSATQDIVIDAYRIESAPLEMQALLSATYIAGYRIGMLTAGAGALYLAGWFGTSMDHYAYHAWQWSYAIMAATMSIGILTTLLISEPAPGRSTEPTARDRPRDQLGFLVLFLCAAVAFAVTFFYTGGWARAASSAIGLGALGTLMIEFARLLAALSVGACVALLLLPTGLTNRAMVIGSYVEPVRDFFRRYGAQAAILLLALVATYRISDIVLGVIANVFYQDIGFTKPEIATVVKTFGLFMTIAGGFIGGVLAMRFGVVRILFLGALLSAATNLLFMWLATIGHSLPMLYVVISADNLSAGLAGAAFVAFLSGLTNISFTAVQYAIFSSLMTLLPKTLGGYSGGMVDAMGYTNFFLLTTLLGIPVLWLVYRAGVVLYRREGRAVTRADGARD